jgi:hypothetical protein
MTELGLGIGPAAPEKLTEAQAAASQVDTNEDAESDIGSMIETVIHSIDYAAEVVEDLLD